MRFVFAILVSTLFYACSPNNVDIENSFEKYFKENQATGTFALFNNSSGRFTSL
jgi:beta-lactamase class D